jgi:DNA-directed RNA polymerase specialized sigma24 family protein
MRACIEEGSPDVAQDDPQGADNAGKRAQSSEAERRDKLTPLVLCRSKLSASEALRRREVFPEILALHQDLVWNRLRKRGLLDQESEDLVQETFFALHNHILEHGFPDNLPGMLRVLTERKLLNHLRDERRDPVSLGLPSSGSEKPRSSLDVERFPLLLAPSLKAGLDIDWSDPKQKAAAVEVVERQVASLERWVDKHLEGAHRRAEGETGALPWGPKESLRPSPRRRDPEPGGDASRFSRAA